MLPGLGGPGGAGGDAGAWLQAAVVNSKTHEMYFNVDVDVNDLTDIVISSFL